MLEIKKQGHVRTCGGISFPPSSLFILSFSEIPYILSLLPGSFSFLPTSQSLYLHSSSSAFLLAAGKTLPQLCDTYCQAHLHSGLPISIYGGLLS